jgi:hypothetical protein
MSSFLSSSSLLSRTRHDVGRRKRRASASTAFWRFLLLTMAPSTDMTAFREVLMKSKHIIAVAGAGLSAASGELAHLRVVTE